MKSKFYIVLTVSLAPLILGALVPEPAHAFERFRSHYGFYGARGGRWVHDWHGGRMGWWWVAGPSWYFYPRPYVVAPPQTVVIQPAPQAYPVAPPPMEAPPAPPAAPPVVAQAPVRYYCRATATFYPDTMSCPGGWSTAVGDAPPAP